MQKPSLKQQPNHQAMVASKSKKFDKSGGKVGLFDIINELSYGKRDLLRSSADGLNHEALKTYSPFIVNRAFSMHLSSIADAAVINAAPDLLPLMQHDYYLHSLPRAKRFSGKWPMSVVDTDLTTVSKEYNIGLAEAKEAIRTMTEDQLQFISNRHESTGGRDNKNGSTKQR